jgi:hypothetical protein
MVFPMLLLLLFIGEMEEDVVVIGIGVKALQDVYWLLVDDTARVSIPTAYANRLPWSVDL